jgi:hypothetical protein
MNVRVTKLTKLTAMVLLALWVPVICHCELERLPGFKFLVCCAHPDLAPHQDNDCEEDGCAVVESGLYRSEECSVTLPAPVPLLTAFQQLLEPVLPELRPVREATGSAPPELVQAWQFSFRTALPPRAPSAVS